MMRGQLKKLICQIRKLMILLERALKTKHFSYKDNGLETQISRVMII